MAPLRRGDWWDVRIAWDNNGADGTELVDTFGKVSPSPAKRQTGVFRANLPYWSIAEVRRTIATVAAG